MSGRGRSHETLALIQAAYEVLEIENPTTIRGVVYRLFSKGLLPDTGKASYAKMSRILTIARNEGSVPWSWIVDNHRKIQRVQTWSNPGEIIKAARDSYRRDYWTDHGITLLCVSEKNTVAEILRPVLDRYAVGFSPWIGFTSTTTAHDTAELSLDGPTVLLYVGDFDPSGRYMSDVDIPRRIERYNGAADVRRVALVEDDLQHLTTFSAATKKADPRHKWFTQRFGTECAELDALPANVLRQRVEDAILEYIDATEWAMLEAVEAAELASMGEFLDRWPEYFQASSKILSDQGARGA